MVIIAIKCTVLSYSHGSQTEDPKNRSQHCLMPPPMARNSKLSGGLALVELTKLPYVEPGEYMY